MKTNTDIRSFDLSYPPEQHWWFFNRDDDDAKIRECSSMIRYTFISAFLFSDSLLLLLLRYHCDVVDDVDLLSEGDDQMKMAIRLY
ncbi:unnamed protein product [Vicia faba]|uniref:Uncharacterized protein n=1 Tax=Vicia faba TaxID=3906 RepID=A0AAV0Z6D4_VICFA|nr:unnamed protein product [Vicia faba]